MGVIRNFEFLLKKVENNYFMFSDQDDIWKENKIEKSLKKMEEDNADLVYSDLEVVDRDLNTIYKSYWKLKGLEKRLTEGVAGTEIYAENKTLNLHMLNLLLDDAQSIHLFLFS